MKNNNHFGGVRNVEATFIGAILDKGATATSVCWSLLGNYGALVKHTENMLRVK